MTEPRSFFWSGFVDQHLGMMMSVSLEIDKQSALTSELIS